MAHFTRERQGEILQNVLAVLADAPDGMEAKNVIAELERRMTLTEFEDAEYPGRAGVRRFPKMVRFTTINAVKAGWLLKQDGTWVLTEAGRDALERFTDPEQLMREAIRLYQEWRKEQGDGEVVAEPAPDIEDEAVPSVTLEEARETAFTELRVHLQEMDPYAFQDLVAALLRAMGYHVLWVAPRGPDGGIDILAQTDPLGTEGPRIKVQVRRRGDKTTVEELRSFLSVLGTHDVGVFVSLGGFTLDAAALAHAQETRRVTLINLSDLLALWTEHQRNIKESDRQLLPLTPVYYLAPGELRS